MREINEIILHCSDSDFGDAALIKGWHTLPKMPPDVADKIRNGTLPKSEARKYGRGWSDIGYHYVILNGYREYKKFNANDDGLIEVGRPIEEIGAHCAGHNENSIGICLIGRRLFSAEQLYVALPTVLKMVGYPETLTLNGHYKYSTKTCPNIDMETLKRFLDNRRIM